MTNPNVRRFVIGTKPPADILVTHDPYVSNRHAELIFFDQGAAFFPGWVGVRDLGSMNGVNVIRKGTQVRQRVVETMLSPGDQLWLGQHTCIPWERLRSFNPEDLRVERWAAADQ